MKVRYSVAQEFADTRRRRLWAKHFEHPDPVHNRPSKEELALLENDKDAGLSQSAPEDQI